jgi:hypothetical protein
MNYLKYKNGLIEESLDVRAGRAKERAEDRYPEIDEKELKARKKKNTARINELLGQSHKMTETKELDAKKFKLSSGEEQRCNSG